MAVTTSATSSNLSLSGLASGMNWTSIISELLTVEAAPELQMNAEKTSYQQKNSAYQSIGTDLATLNKDIATLSAPSFFNSRTTAVSDPTVASATATSGTPLGTYTFAVSQLATEAVQQGSAASGKLNSDRKSVV